MQNNILLTVGRILLVLALIIIFIICMLFINQKYDKLARYPFKNEIIRQKIKDNLTEKEIDYLIEYSIAPQEFSEYIGCKKFNIYHLKEYHYLNSWASYLSKNEIIDFVEKVYELSLEPTTFLKLIEEYGSSDLLYWLEKKDSFVGESYLVAKPYDFLSIPDSNHSLGSFVPYDLLSLDNLGYSDLLLRKPAALAIKELLENSKNLNFKLLKAYYSYKEQVKDYKLGLTPIKPGHQERQMGLTVVFSTINKEQEEYLIKHAYLYGLVKLDDNNNIYRYVGKELAQKMFIESLTFLQYKEVNK